MVFRTHFSSSGEGGHKPFNFALCARRYLLKPLHPFSYETVNADELTRANAAPLQIFDTNKFHYHYDNLELGGHSVKELNELIKDMRSESRLFVALVLFGFGTSASVQVDIDHNGHKEKIGTFYVLGGETEMPWAYERAYKLDMTEAARKLNMDQNSIFNFEVSVTKYDGTPLTVDLPSPFVIHRPANADYDVHILPMSPLTELPPKIVLRKGARVIFQRTHPLVTGPIKEVGSFTNSVYCAIPPGDANSYHLDTEYSLQPGTYYFVSGDEERCRMGRSAQITVDDE
nr:hypothetical protein BaRGS_031767 [Batillaria attramentaria]KAG5695880.1 hypothetical protein BaRGS_017318 [Batillaria attramentaria]